MKPAFVRTKDGTYFRDRNGREWSTECLQELVDAFSKLNYVFEITDHYKNLLEKKTR